MARIRSIKPEFFSDKKLAGCSAHARLLAISLLQLCDAKGRFLHIPMQLHAHAFPWEAGVNTPALLRELEAIGYVFLYEVGGKEYGCVPGFNKHQRLQGKEAQSEGIYPPPNQGVTRTVGEQGSGGEFPSASPRIQEQGTGNREQVEDANASLSPDGDEKVPACPQKEIIAEYHKILPELSSVRVWHEARQKKLRARWAEAEERQNLEWWREFFKFVRGCPHLMGANDRGWQADLEWLVKQENFVKVVEGKYKKIDVPKRRSAA